jgi:hypothetical protein
MTTVNGLRVASLGESLEALYTREVISRPKASHRAILLRSLEPAHGALRLRGAHLEQQRLQVPPPLEREVELFI